MTTRGAVAGETDPLARIAELTHFVRFEIARHRERTRPAALVLPVPAAPPEALLRMDPASSGVLWEPPGGPAIAGLGEARRIDVSGRDRFERVEEAAEELWSELVVLPHPEAAPFTPSLVGGFSFEPEGRGAPEWKGFGAGSFTLPRWTYFVAPGDGPDDEPRRAVLVLTLATPDDFEREGTHLQRFERIFRVLARPPELAMPQRAHHHVVRQMEREEWSALVERARAAIGEGRFQKVVLARQTHLTVESALEATDVLGRLRELQPDAYRFAFRRGLSTFLGATPEPLVVKRGLTVRGEALAGTAPRAEGADAALAASAKDRAEHAPVVEAIRGGLAPFCATLEIPSAPEVRVLRDVLHLSTPVIGTLHEPVPLPRLVEALHPTPATGGSPRDAALLWLAENEPDDRGWYAGPVGRIGMDGDGEFAVAIRSALLAGKRAVVFAGAGIVAGSDPASEFEETAAKERTILSALET